MMVIDCCLMPPACIILCQCQACNTQLGGNISVVLLLGGGSDPPLWFSTGSSLHWAEPPSIGEVIPSHLLDLCITNFR